jgi:hypothetical protein
VVAAPAAPAAAAVLAARRGEHASHASLAAWTGATSLLIGFLFVALQTVILIRGPKTTFRWQNEAFIIAMVGALIAFVVLAVGSRHGFLTNLSSVNHKFGGGNTQQIIGQATAGGAQPDLGRMSATLRSRAPGRADRRGPADLLHPEIPPAAAGREHKLRLQGAAAGVKDPWPGSRMTDLTDD